MLKRSAQDDVISGDVTATTTLAEYLRQQEQLPGTKTMCREGMCGACVVNVTSVNPATGRQESRAVNSCMVPLQACQDWNIEVVTRPQLRHRPWIHEQKNSKVSNG